MSLRLLLAALLFPLAALAEDAPDGEYTFKAKCSQCHSFPMARGRLAAKPAESRPAYLEKFLETHPPKLTDSDKQAVIAALSGAER